MSKFETIPPYENPVVNELSDEQLDAVVGAQTGTHAAGGGGGAGKVDSYFTHGAGGGGGAGKVDSYFTLIE